MKLHQSPHFCTDYGARGMFPRLFRSRKLTEFERESTLLVQVPCEESSLAEFTIPEVQRPPLNKLRTIPVALFQELLSALEKSPFNVPTVHGLSDEDIAEMKDAISELYRVREFFNVDVPEFAAGIADGLHEAVNFPAGEISAFRDRLEKVLTTTPLSIAAKATSLKAEYERRFCNARMLTDARPIYVDTPSSRPDAVMITHTLRITFHDDTGAMRETYITMDDNDLITLRELVDRAEEKAKSLQSVFSAASVPVVTP